MKHKTAIRYHAIRRFWERLKIDLSLEEYHTLNQKCNDRTFTTYKGMNGANQILLINNYQGWRFRVAFDAVKGRIVTVLPNSIQKLDLEREASKQQILEKAKLPLDKETIIP